MHLSSVDLNLLVVLAALLETQSVKEAAERLALSPSATSHALGRLRELLNDPVLVRAGRRLVPTQRVAALRPELDELLDRATAMLQPPDALDPATLRRAFQIVTNDYGELLLMAPLGARLAQVAPEVNLYAVRMETDPVGQLRGRGLDLGLGFFAELPADLQRETLYRDRFVCLLRKEHPAIAAGRLTLKRYLALDHLLVAPHGEPTGVVDRLLAREGRARRVARTVTSFLVAPAVIATSDCVVTIAERVAKRFADPYGLVIRPAPVAPDPYGIQAVWHQRHEADPAHRWLREQIREVARNA